MDGVLNRRSRPSDYSRLPPESGSSAAAGSSGSLTIGAIIALSLLAIVGIALTITFGVLWGNNRFPKTFTAETIPKTVNDFALEYYIRSECGDRSSFTTPTSAIALGFEGCYFRTNKTARLPFLDEKTPRELLHEEFHRRYPSLLNSGYMTPAQEVPLRTLWNRESIYDVTQFTSPLPQKCIDMLRVLNLLALNMFGNWLSGETPNSPYITGPGARENEFQVLPVYDSTTFAMYLDELEKLRNNLIQMRTAAFYERQDAYVFARFGVRYALGAALFEIGGTFDALTYLWDSSDFDGGSSLLYDTVLLKAAQYNYFLSPEEDTALRSAIAETETETIQFLNYQFDVFTAIPLYDESADPYVTGPAGYARAFSGNVSAECIPLVIKGAWVRNTTDFVNQIVSEVLANRAIAEPILTNLLPDYLGWNLTWVHVFFGTEAGYTELGFYPPVDCPTDGPTDPAFAYVMREDEEQRRKNTEMGTLFARSLPKTMYFSNAFGGCDDSFGNAFVTQMIGDHAKRGSGLVALGPTQPKDDNIFVSFHEGVHWHQLSRAVETCPTCHYHRLLTDIQFGMYGRMEAIANTEGFAMYAERNVTLDDMSFNVRGSGTMREAAHALTQNLIRLFAAGARVAITSGQFTEVEYATFIQENEWFPWDTFDDAIAFVRRSAYGPTVESVRFFYTTGAFRIQKLRERVIAACGPDGHHKRIWDAEMSLPLNLLALERAVDDFIASNCQNWPYENIQ